jgi:putative addiction module killer protein
MEKWFIGYWCTLTGKNPVEKWLDRLEHDQLKSVLKELILLKEAGNELELPHSRPLKQGLFELRERRYGYRVYYGFYGTRIIVLLTAGDKSTQDNDIKVARQRLSDVTPANIKEVEL